MIQPEDRFTANKKKFLSSVFSDEMMLMNLETGNYIGLNAVSTDIFQLAEEETTTDRIIESLLKKYNVEEETCRAEVFSCINTMIEKGLLVKV